MPNPQTPQSLTLSLEGVDVVIRPEDSSLLVTFPDADHGAPSTVAARGNFMTLVLDALKASYFYPQEKQEEGRSTGDREVHSVTAHQEFSNRDILGEDMLAAIRSYWLAKGQAATAQGTDISDMTTQQALDLEIPQSHVSLAGKSPRAEETALRRQLYQTLEGLGLNAASHHAGDFAGMAPELGKFITRGLVDIAMDSAQAPAAPGQKMQNLLLRGEDPLAGRIDSWLKDLPEEDDTPSELRRQINECASMPDQARQAWARECASVICAALSQSRGAGEN